VVPFLNVCVRRTERPAEFRRVAETAARIFTEIKLEQGIPEAISATPVRRLSIAP